MIATDTLKSETEIVIQPKSKLKLFDFAELWRFRELFLIFTWRDIKVRYKQTVLGIVWVIFQPLATSGIFTLFFGKLAKIPSDGLPYELFIFTGLTLWSFFSSALSSSANSMVENANLIKKVYFPREILPFSSIVTLLVDYGINFIALLLVVFYFGYIPSPLIILVLPIVLLIVILTASGLGFFLSSFNVKYRDVRYILPFFIQLLLFLTPIIYPSSIVRSSFRVLFMMNPLAGAIESLRLVISGSSDINFVYLGMSLLTAAVIFILGIYYFRSTEKFFADQA